MAALLDDRVAVVTGGAGGIGAAVTATFAAHGAAVVVADVAVDRLEAAVAELHRAGRDVHGCVADVRDPHDVTRLRDLVLARHGRVDVLVNNVGDFLGGRAAFVDTDADDWDAQYATNLRSVMLCTRALLPPMLDAGTGSVITMSSVEGFRAIPGLVAYGTFKGAIDAFTKSLAVEVAPSGVRVNAIAPDKVQSIQTAYEQRWTPHQLASVPQWVPLGRLGRPEDVAGAALWLASDLAGFVTGTTIHVDGGTWAAGGWYRTPGGSWTNTPPMVPET